MQKMARRKGTESRWLWCGYVARGDWCHLCGGRKEPAMCVDYLPNAEHLDAPGNHKYIRACRACLSALLKHINDNEIKNSKTCSKHKSVKNGV
jgi:hypothetical protein